MLAASYPNFAGKHGHAAIFSPAEVVASLTANSTVLAPDAVILTYQPFLLDELRARGVQPATGYPAPWGSLWFTGSGERTIAALAVGGTAPESGLAWTIDAPYRETEAEARSYQAEGVVCVEMEAAALFTVGRYRGVDVAAAFAISDHLLAEDRWTHAFGTPTLRQASIRLLDAALHALSGQQPPAR
jgi:nucleoside phosphorylase